MKNLLLKIADWINQRYGVKIGLMTKFYFQGRLYKVVAIENRVSVNAKSILNIETEDYI